MSKLFCYSEMKYRNKKVNIVLGLIKYFPLIFFFHRSINAAQWVWDFFFIQELCPWGCYFVDILLAVKRDKKEGKIERE